MSDRVIHPVLGQGVYIAPTAFVGGDVTLGDECSIWHQVVIRGDVSAIRLGRRVNVQDATIIHTRRGVPLEIEDEVSIGHRAVVHCRRVGTGALIGVGSIVLDDAEVGAGAIVGAGALVPPGHTVPAGKVVVGTPARVLRDVTDKDRAYIAHVIASYVELAKLHAAGHYPNAAPH